MTAAIISSRNMVSAHYANIYNVQPIMRAYIYVVSVYYFDISVVLSMPMYILKNIKSCFAFVLNINLPFLERYTKIICFTS